MLLLMRQQFCGCESASCLSRPCGLLDAQIDNGRSDGCYTCVVV